MLSISLRDDGEVVLAGRFDASQVDRANAVLDRLAVSTRLNFQDLEYISSAGLGTLLKTQKRLAESRQSLTLVHVNKMIRDIFRIARFDLVFPIEE